MPSGGLTQKIVAPDTEVFLRLDASTVKSVPDVGHFSTQQVITNNKLTKT